MRAAEFIKRNYHWFFAALAVILVAARYMPAVCLSALNADDVQIPLMYHDVTQLGHSPGNWGWGGHSDLFPDVATGLLLNSIFRDGVAAIQASFSVMLAAYITVLVLLHRKVGGRNPGTFGAMLFVFFVLSLVNFGASNSHLFQNSLAFTYHTGTSIMALACFGLCMDAAVNGCGKAFRLLPVLCFATAVSDDIFQVIFPVPILATLLTARLLYPKQVRLFIPLVAAIVISCLAGLLLAPHLSPFQINPGPYTHFDRDGALLALHQFLLMCKPSVDGDFLFFVVIDLLFITFAAVVLVSSFFKPADQRIPLPIFLVLLFGACLIDSNWGAALLTGDFDMHSARYIHLAIMFPVFVLLGWINHIVPWSGASAKRAVAVLCGAVCCFAVFVVPQPGPTWQSTQRLIPILHDVMEKNHIEAGLADYWVASPVALLSHGSIPLRAALPDGSLFHWLNTTVWYTGDGVGQPPKFGMIYMRTLNPDNVIRHYGNPDQVIHCPTGDDLWLYLGDRAIAYNPVFGTLSNGPLNECVTDGYLLPSYTGQKEGLSRVAREGRDRPSFLVYGPFPYLAPEAGRYRITIVHTFYAAPAAGKLPFYDVTCAKGKKSRSLDQARIPFTGLSQQEFTRDVTIPDNDRGLIQVRVQYFGSGSIGIDSLKIVRLDR